MTTEKEIEAEASEEGSESFTKMIRWLTLAGLLVAAIIAIGAILLPEIFWDNFLWPYLWGPVVSDARGIPLGGGGVFNKQQLVLKRPFQCFPGHRIHQERLDFHDEKTAVGLQQRAGFHQSEIGGHTTHVGFLFNLPEHVVVGGVGLEDNGGPLGAAAVGDDIDLVLGE